jgi:peptidoglycan/xylan/chitin deacetylase (PgdA/CDA1 family)
MGSKKIDAWVVLLVALLVLALTGCLPEEGGAPTVSQVVTSSTTPSSMPPTATLIASPSATVTPTATSAPRHTATSFPSPTRTPTPPSGMVYHPAGPVTVPILLYHRISDKGRTRYFVTVASFRAQMRELHDAGYQTITVTQLAEVIRAGGYLPEKPIILTFDDGFLDVYENAFPILQSYNFQGVAYIITGTLGTRLSYGYMQEEELKELAEAGWEIGSHTISHENLKETRLGAEKEIRQSKEELEDKIGMPVRSFSYPYAVANDWIKARVEESGYEAAVGVGMLTTHEPDRLYFLSRREVTYGTTLAAFRQLLSTGQQQP